MQHTSDGFSSQPKSDTSMEEDSKSQIDDVIGDKMTPSNTSLVVSKSSTEIPGKEIHTEKSVFDESTPEFSTMDLDKSSSFPSCEVSKRPSEYSTTCIFAIINF